MSNNRTSTSGIPTGDTPTGQPKFKERLAEVIRDIGYYLPQHRSEFKDKLYHYLESGVSLSLGNEENFYVTIESIKEIDSLFAKEIFIRFTLTKEQPEQSMHKVSLIELSEHASVDSVEYSFEVSPDNKEIFGGQVMYYTFSSLENIKEGINKFRYFVEQAYESPDEIKAKNRKAWDRLLLDSAPSNREGENR